MKQLGIWLDKNKAIIVALEDEKENVTIIESNIEHYHVQGGSGTRFKGGPQDVVQDKTYLEREKHQLRSYFKEIVTSIKDANELVIIGPAGLNEKFNKELLLNHKEIGSKVKGVIKTDSMTNNQIKAWVKNFFKA